jgi:hypothetical protein
MVGCHNYRMYEYPMSFPTPRKYVWVLHEEEWKARRTGVHDIYYINPLQENIPLHISVDQSQTDGIQTLEVLKSNHVGT